MTSLASGSGLRADVAIITLGSGHDRDRAPEQLHLLASGEHNRPRRLPRRRRALEGRPIASPDAAGARRTAWTFVMLHLVLALAAALASANCPWITAADAADITARDIAARLVDARADRPLDLAGRDLARLDLSGLDFKSARLAGADLFGADLSGADLGGANLAGARLDRITMVSTRFDRADLTGASLLRPSGFSSLASDPGEASTFSGARLVRAKIFGRFHRADLTGADLTDATLAPFGKTGFIEHIWRTEFLAARLDGAQLVRADLGHVLLAFASLKGADLTGARLANADLTGADLTGATLTGADLTDADVMDARFTGAIGLETVKGWDTTRNTARAVR